MSEIKYIVGDATQPVDKSGTKNFILHCCNDVGGWGAGFVVALSRVWKEPEQMYRQAFSEEVVPQLGDVQFCQVEEGLQVVNIIGQHNYKNYGSMKPVRYDALREGFYKVAEEHSPEQGKTITVHMPQLGAGLAGGQWAIIALLIEEIFCARNIPVYVYQLPHLAIHDPLFNKQT